MMAMMVLSSVSLYAQRQKIDVSDFTQLSFGVPGTVYLKQGSSASLEIEADEEMMERIEIVQEGKKLKIRTRNNSWSWKNWSSGSVKIYATMRTIEGLGVSGSGQLVSQGTLEAGDLSLAVSGSGDMELDVRAEDIDISISGSGSVQLAGRGNRAEASVSGSGKVKAEGMEVDVFKAQISGSGSCYITANEEIDASISGSGSIYYSGNPRSVNSRSSGSGKIRKM